MAALAATPFLNAATGPHRVLFAKTSIPKHEIPAAGSDHGFLSRNKAAFLDAVTTLVSTLAAAVLAR
jgi:hypothetical protein